MRHEDFLRVSFLINIRGRTGDFETLLGTPAGFRRRRNGGTN